MTLLLLAHGDPQAEDSRNPANPLDGLRLVPAPAREVTVTLAGACRRPVLERELHTIADQSAFDLAALRPSASDHAGSWEAVFRLRAVHGRVGDAQIYALLRLLAGPARWLEVRKGSGTLQPARAGHQES